MNYHYMIVDWFQKFFPEFKVKCNVDYTTLKPTKRMKAYIDYV